MRVDDPAITAETFDIDAVIGKHALEFLHRVGSPNAAARQDHGPFRAPNPIRDPHALSFKFGGTMESTEAVLSGSTQAHAAWFANAKYLLSDPYGQSRVKLQEKIMLSPITVSNP